MLPFLEPFEKIILAILGHEMLNKRIEQIDIVGSVCRIFFVWFQNCVLSTFSKGKRCHGVSREVVSRTYPL